MIVSFFDSPKICQLIGGSCLLAMGCGGTSGAKPKVVQEKPAAQVAQDSKPEPEPTLAQLAEKATIQLESFLRRDDLSPAMRAQAMFRLAALHDDRVADEGPKHREVAIVLYMQIIRDFPETEVAASSHLFLGYDLHAAGHQQEAQHVFRSLVCNNHFSFVPPPQLVATFPVKPLPQSHDEAYWRAWETNHRVPIDPLAKKKGAKPDEETVFINPYPPDCKPLLTPTSNGQTPQYLGNAWWEIGEFHFNQIDPAEGPYSFNLAATAYQNAIRHGNPTLRTLAIYKLAWTNFKQQRYEAAVAQFVDLLRQPAESPAQTKDKAVDLAKEACTYIAGSLTYVDFRGPSPEDPYIVREDVLDTEKNPRIAEQKMHVALDRVRDPKIIPQNERWTSDIYMALIDEFRELMQWRNMIETSELFLAKWPADPRADAIRKGIEQARARAGNP